jgi:hypothetical protein
MRIQQVFAVSSIILLLLFAELANDKTARAQNNKSKYACSEPDSASICNANNTCGSPAQACSVDVKRTVDAASVTPSIPGAKENSRFCVKVGTNVTWKSDTKHQGFVVDMGPTSPFDPPEDIVGGSAKSVTVKAKTPGCYKFSAGACLSGAMYGMCGNGTAELVIFK